MCFVSFRKAGGCGQIVCTLVLFLMLAGIVILLTGFILYFGPSGVFPLVTEYNRESAKFKPLTDKDWSWMAAGSKSTIVTSDPISSLDGSNKILIFSSTYLEIKFNYSAKTEIKYEVTSVEPFTRTITPKKGDLYLESYCAVAKPSSSGQYMYIEDKNKISCDYPFNEDGQKYTDKKPSQITFQLRSSEDPYIIFQRLSKGEGYIDNKSSLIGFLMICVGTVIICISAVLMTLSSSLFAIITPGKNYY